jgi:CBS domain-containing protein
MKDLSHFVIDINATIIQAIEKIENNRSRAVIVTLNTKVVGLISEGDIMRALLRGMPIHQSLSILTMSSFKYLTNPNMEKAFELMKKHLFTLVPVIDSEFKLVDVITMKDILNACYLQN